MLLIISFFPVMQPPITQKPFENPAWIISIRFSCFNSAAIPAPHGPYR